MRFKYRIKEIGAIRAVKHLTKEVSVVCDVTHTTASQWINLHSDDKRDIPAGQLWKIAQYLNVPISDLYQKEDDQLSHINNNNIREEVSGLS